MRKLMITAVAIGAMVLPMAGTAAAAPGNGNGNGSVGCTLSGGEHFANPADMLKFLADRDGSFQNTVEKYDHIFASVGDLIDQKCGA